MLVRTDRLPPGESVALLVMPRRIEVWTSTSLQQRLVKTGGFPDRR